MTKSDQIRSLLQSGRSTAEIAAAVGCAAAYVRAVKRRTDASGAPRTPEADRVGWRRSYRARYGVDLAWTECQRQKRRERYASDAEYRERHLQRCRDYRQARRRAREQHGEVRS